MKKMLFVLPILLLVVSSCEKEPELPLRYYEVGMKHDVSNWRDSSFIVATFDTALIKAIEAELKLPIDQRRFVDGRLLYGDGGYNKNRTHRFAWHFKENDWKLSEITQEIYDGMPYTDVDLNTKYWVDTIKRFAPWTSYIKRELPKDSLK